MTMTCLKLGSNSKKVPKRSWTCEFCTYVNNPGVIICAMCCKTKAPDDLASSRSKQPSEDSDQDRSRKSSAFKQRAIKGRSGRDGSMSRRLSVSPRPKMLTRDDNDNLSDLERDAVDTYYAVRMGLDDRRQRGKSRDRNENEGK